MEKSKNLQIEANSTQSNIMTINFLKFSKFISVFLDPIPPKMLMKHAKLFGVTNFKQS